MIYQRPSWDTTWFDAVEIFARRGSCPRLRTACILVSPRNRFLAMGYNGSPPGHPTCDEVGCEIYESHCLRTIHSEMNALNNAAMFGIPVEGATAYIAHRPCVRCATALVAAGIKRILYREEYQSYDGDPSVALVERVCDLSGVVLMHVAR